MNASSSLRSEAKLAAARAKAIGLTQAAIADAVGASQSQVSRVLSGMSRRRSRLFDSVCKYVFSAEDAAAFGRAPQDSDQLMRALGEVWDGSDAHAEALALVIRSLGALGSTRPLASRPSTRQR
jgi:transcriptional regulator with XRE-family HTH domain